MLPLSKELEAVARSCSFVLFRLSCALGYAGYLSPSSVCLVVAQVQSPRNNVVRTWKLDYRNMPSCVLVCLGSPYLVSTPLADVAVRLMLPYLTSFNYSNTPRLARSRQSLPSHLNVAVRIATDQQDRKHPKRASLGELGLDKMRCPDPLLAGTALPMAVRSRFTSRDLETKITGAVMVSHALLFLHCFICLPGPSTVIIVCVAFAFM